MKKNLQIDELLADVDVQELLGVSRTTLWRLRKEAGLPYGRVGRKYRYRKSEVLQWLKDNRNRPVQLMLNLEGDKLNPQAPLPRQLRGGPSSHEGRRAGQGRS